MDEMDRRHLAYYVGTMIRRVLSARIKARAMVPGVLANVAREVREWFEQAAREGNIDQDTLNARVAEADEVEERYLRQSPAQVTTLIETPWPFETMLLAIYGMWWRVLRSEGPSFFLTSDNPAYFFEAHGLGNDESELTFPLCRDTCFCTARGR